MFFIFVVILEQKPLIFLVLFCLCWMVNFQSFLYSKSNKSNSHQRKCLFFWSVRKIQNSNGMSRRRWNYLLFSTFLFRTTKYNFCFSSEPHTNNVHSKSVPTLNWTDFIWLNVSTVSNALLLLVFFFFFFTFHFFHFLLYRFRNKTKSRTNKHKWK